MSLILLRHTKPDVTEGTCYGRTDLDLGPDFDQHAEALLATLPAFGRVVTSPLRRCRLLAERIAARRRLPLAVEPGFVEMDFGAWEGLRWDDVPREGLDAWAADFMDARPHGGESVAMLAARVVAAARAHLAPEGAVLVVTHMGPIRAALSWSEGAAGWKAKVDFGAWVRVDPSRHAGLSGRVSPAPAGDRLPSRPRQQTRRRR